MTMALRLAGTPCCARLTAIGFSSNLPVLIVDTHGQQFQVPTNISHQDVCMDLQRPARSRLKTGSVDEEKTAGVEETNLRRTHLVAVHFPRCCRRPRSRWMCAPAALQTPARITTAPSTCPRAAAATQVRRHCLPPFDSLRPPPEEYVGSI